MRSDGAEMSRNLGTLLAGQMDMARAVARSSAEKLRQPELAVLRTEQETGFQQIHSAMAQQRDGHALESGLKRLEISSKAGFERLAASLETQPLHSGSMSLKPTTIDRQNAVKKTVNRAVQSQDDMVCITATLASLTCPRFCRCRCHSPRSLRSPSWMRNILGQMMLSYTPLIYATSCDYPPCRKRPQRSQFTYYFPGWVASRALVLRSVVNDLSGIGASWTVKMPIVVEESTIFSAAGVGNIQHIQRQFSQRLISPFIVNIFGQTLLHVSHHSCSILPRVYIHTKWPQVPLSCQSDDKAFERLTTVQYAADRNQAALYHLLLGVGADPLMEDFDGVTAHSLLLGYKQRGPFGLDLEAAADEQLFTPLHLAVVLPSHIRRLTSELLQQEYREVNRSDRLGRTPLHWASLKGDSAAVQLLLQWRANANSLDYRRMSPLVDACYSGDAVCAAMLLDAGAAIGSMDHEGAQPLRGIQDTNADLVDLFKRHGADLDHSDIDGWTALHYAAKEDQAQVAERLLRAGADPCLTDSWGRGPLEVAVDNDSPQVLSTLLNWRAPPSVSAIGRLFFQS